MVTVILIFTLILISYRIFTLSLTPTWTATQKGDIVEIAYVKRGEFPQLICWDLLS